jgi:hypothetical protein
MERFEADLPEGQAKRCKMGMWSVSHLPKGSNKLPLKNLEFRTETEVPGTHGNVCGAVLYLYQAMCI